MHFNTVLAPFRYSYIFQLFSNMNVTKNVWQTFFLFRTKSAMGAGGVTPQYLPLYGPWFSGITSLELLERTYIGSKSYRDKG